MVQVLPEGNPVERSLGQRGSSCPLCLLDAARASGRCQPRVLSAGLHRGALSGVCLIYDNLRHISGPLKCWRLSESVHPGWEVVQGSILVPSLHFVAARIHTQARRTCGVLGKANVHAERRRFVSLARAAALGKASCRGMTGGTGRRAPARQPDLARGFCARPQAQPEPQERVLAGSVLTRTRFSCAGQRKEGSSIYF